MNSPQAGRPRHAGQPAGPPHRHHTGFTSRAAIRRRRERISRAARRSSFVARLRGQAPGEPITGLPFTGVLFAVLGVVGSGTASLLPRPWYMQGIIVAIVAVLAYATGVVLGSMLRALGRAMELRVSVSAGARHILTAAWVFVVTAALLGTPVAAFGEQVNMARFAGVEVPQRWYIPASIATSAVLFTVFVGLWRLIAATVDWFTAAFAGNAWRDWAARVAASILTVTIAGVALDQVVLRGGLAIASYQSERVNETAPSGRTPPDSPLRSGGPGSSESWDSLGQDGAIFVSSGPSRARIAQVTGEAASDPIRVFAGVVEGYSLEETTRRVLAEMDRTGAFGRPAIYLASATSTGYINEWSVQAFEYLTGGDCATVSMAYSTLPSAIALLAAPDRPPRASRMLLDAVRARLDAMPAATRPRLYVGGESLGAYAGNGAFDSAEAMLAQVDGAVWTGTPSFTPVHRQLTDRRRAGSTEVNPVIDAGRQVRFASNPAELWADQYGSPLGSWQTPRVVYLQHDSDPVVWWSPALAVRTPQWLAETRTSGPMSQMSWLPLVTFWQVTADMTMSNNVPGGEGHRYQQSETVPAWAAVLGQEGRADAAARSAAISGAIRQATS